MNKYFLIFLVLLYSVVVYSQNHMDVMQSMVGEYGNSYFGEGLTTLDFNGDGIDDLVVYSRGGSSTNAFGKLYLYYGGADFDSIPDLVKEGEYIGNIYRWVRNAGDANGDGYEDLLSVEQVNPNDYQHFALRYYYGGPNPHLIVDHEIEYVDSGYEDTFVMDCLGDVNSDGCDDLGVMTTSVSDTTNLSIVLGGSFEIVPVIRNVAHSIACLISGVGDVNGDGIDDFMVGYAPDLFPEPDYPRYRYLYYGSQGLDLNNRVLMLESNQANQVFPGGFRIGDFNGDGNDDFLISYVPSQIIDSLRIKMGSANLPESAEYNFTGPPVYPLMPKIEPGSQSIGFGDFNGDGFSDVVGSNYTAITWAGIAGIWLGRATPNGTNDMPIMHPSTSPYHQFGWSVTTGDYNNDGKCDIAASAPNSQSEQPFYPGWVYVFAGNGQLTDTTVGNEDQVAVDTPTVKLDIFPNPVKHDHVILNYSISGDLPRKISSASIVLYNIKGQVVTKSMLTLNDLRRHAGVVHSQKLPSAIYIAALNIDNKRIATTKFTVK